MPPVHNHYVVAVLSLALVTCSKPAPNVAAARNSMVGMNTEQVTSCMGRPGTALTQDSTTVWSTTHSAVRVALRSSSIRPHCPPRMRLSREDRCRVHLRLP